MKAIQAIRAFLDGRKTYLGMIAGGILGILWSYGLISDDTARLVATIIATWTGISMRAAISKTAVKE